MLQYILYIITMYNIHDIIYNLFIYKNLNEGTDHKQLINEMLNIHKLCD